MWTYFANFFHEQNLDFAFFLFDSFKALTLFYIDSTKIKVYFSGAGVIFDLFFSIFLPYFGGFWVSYLFDEFFSTLMYFLSFLWLGIFN